MDIQHEDDKVLHEDAIKEVVQEVLVEHRANALLFRTTVLDSENLASLSTVPVELVPAPGPGFVVVPITLAVQYVAGLTPYDGTTSIGIIWENQTNYIMETQVDTSLTVSEFGWGAMVSNHLALSDVENKTITTSPSDASDVINGDGTVRITIGYYLQEV